MFRIILERSSRSVLVSSIAFGPQGMAAEYIAVASKDGIMRVYTTGRTGTTRSTGDGSALSVVQRRDHEYARLERGFAAPRRCQLFRWIGDVWVSGPAAVFMKPPAAAILQETAIARYSGYCATRNPNLALRDISKSRGRGTRWISSAPHSPFHIMMDTWHYSAQEFAQILKNDCE